jgi:hypothetical protein
MKNMQGCSKAVLTGAALSKVAGRRGDGELEAADDGGAAPGDELAVPAQDRRRCDEHPVAAADRK